MELYVISDRGRVRETNEDFAAAAKIAGCGVFVLADGMGGAHAGEVASKTAGVLIMEYIKKRLQKNMSPGKIFSMLRGAVNRANIDVYTMAQTDKNLSGMGTTAEACVIAGNTAYVAHVGDSRVYKISPPGKIYCVTRDHSLVEHMVEIGAISPEEAKTHPQRNVITRAVGTDKTVEADTYAVSIKNGDRLLICSDGLTNMLTDGEILKLAASGSCEESARKLVRDANSAGGYDNISVILAECNAQ